MKFGASNFEPTETLGQGMTCDRIVIYGTVGAAFTAILIFNLILWFTPSFH